jgi:hypothetical protein
LIDDIRTSTGTREKAIMSPSRLAALLLQWTMGEVLALAALLFIPAWTIHYWQGWVFIVVFVVSTNAVGIYVALTDPALLQRRRKAGPTKERAMIRTCGWPSAW